MVHGDKVVGLLGRNALLRGMALEGSDSYIAAHMERDFVSISPDKDLSEILPLMASAGACALVMQDEKLLGLLTSENLSQFLLLRSVGLRPEESV